MKNMALVLIAVVLVLSGCGQSNEVEVSKIEIDNFTNQASTTNIALGEEEMKKLGREVLTQYELASAATDEKLATQTAALFIESEQAEQLEFLKSLIKPNLNISDYDIVITNDSLSNIDENGFTYKADAFIHFSNNSSQEKHKRAHYYEIIFAKENDHYKVEKFDWNVDEDNSEMEYLNYPDSLGLDFPPYLNPLVLDQSLIDMLHQFIARLPEPEENEVSFNIVEVIRLEDGSVDVTVLLRNATGNTLIEPYAHLKLVQEEQVIAEQYIILDKKDYGTFKSGSSKLLFLTFSEENVKDKTVSLNPQKAIIISEVKVN